MASSMIDILGQQLGQEAMAGMLAQKTGLDPSTARQAVKIGLPLIVAALARNSADAKGADALSGALARDHDGSLLDNLDGYLKQGGNPSMGDAILGHVLGGDRSQIEAEVGRETGLDPSVLAKLLPLLAPLVLAYLGRAQRQEQLSPGDLSGYLNRERATIEQAGFPGVLPPSQAQPGPRSTIQEQGADILSGMLDANKDGSVTDDAARIGMGMLGKLLRRKG